MKTQANEVRAWDDRSQAGATPSRARGPAGAAQGKPHLPASRREQRPRRQRFALLLTVATLLAGGVVVWVSRLALASILTLIIGGASGAQALQLSAAKPTPTPLPTPTPRLPSEPVPVGSFATRVYTDANGHSMTYYLYAPPSYTPSGSYPLVLVLHGGGEVAEPNVSAQQNRDVLIDQSYVQAYAQTKIQEQYPAFVVAPQVPAGQRWVNVPAGVSSYTLAAQPSLSLALAEQIVQSLEQIYPMIDPNRVYVSGISMGGFGTWEAAERWPSTFAAAVPVSGAGDPQAASALVHVPVWALHGTLDNVVPVQGSRLMIQAITADGGLPCYTEFPQGGHNIWVVQNLDNPQLLSWMYSQTKSPGHGITPEACPAQSG